MKRISIICVVAICGGGCVPASAEEDRVEKSFHEKMGWEAEDYFDDPQVVALCRATDANDLKEIDRLVAAGADVNAHGKGNMTPLLWSFFDNKLEHFTRMLEHGADPNVFTTSDLGTRGAFGAGNSVTHMACKTRFPGYFDAVFDHGGDPNLVSADWMETPLRTVITGGSGDKDKKIRRLLALGADMNHLSRFEKTPVMDAVTWGGQYGLALILLEAGADYKHVNPNWGGSYRLVHSVRREERRRHRWGPQQKKDYEKLVAWLEAHGESMEQAQKDIDEGAAELQRRATQRWEKEAREE